MNRLLSRTVILCALLAASHLRASCADEQQIVDKWKYTLRPPGEGWMQPDFNEEQWQEGFGGFGTHGTPGARIGTVWSTRQIWLRKRFVLTNIPARPVLLIHHDETADVFLNGHKIAALTGYTTRYITVPLGEQHKRNLKVGENVLAVRCRQTTGGQFIDAHIVDGDHVPQLPAPQRSQKPFESPLITKWGEAVTPENAWREYPRPGLQRRDWTCLNGLWSYAVTPADQTSTPETWDGQILVPFCLESRLGGVGRLLDPDEALWYRRTFDRPEASELRTILNFEAVDYRCRVFVNGRLVGEHTGGHTPFSFDISSALRNGANELIVRVEDQTEGWQLRGKQTLNPHGIWYTQVSGIWQTVWLEQVPQTYLRDLRIETDRATGRIDVRPLITGESADCQTEVTVFDDGKQVAQATATGRVSVTVPAPRLWSPESPHLYQLTVRLVDRNGDEVDRVESYAGIRSVEKVRDADGHWRMALNGKVLFHWGPLDQGWWPDGLLTPPSDAAMRSDIEFLKRAGFNMIRKHIKVEPRRYYYHCDRLGMMVWQDHVSGGTNSAWPAWTRLKPDPVDAEWPDQHHRQFMLELERMIDTLENHACIVCWIPFNERWGQHRTVEVGRWVQNRDPSRLLNIASGGNFWPVGDVVDAHSYPHPVFPFDQGRGGRFDDYIKVMGEFGGHGFVVTGHLWDPNRRNWGYGDLPQSKEEYQSRYVESLNRLNELRHRGIAAGVYTQTTDVEGEINGLMTYDRRVIKISADKLAELHRRLFEQRPPGAVSGISQ